MYKKYIVAQGNMSRIHEIPKSDSVALPYLDYDVDSAGMLAYKKDWKIIDDSYAFLNAIRLIVFLITGKWVNYNFIAFCFFSIWYWIGQHDPFLLKIDKFKLFFKEYCCIWVFYPRIWNILWMRFSANNLLHHFKKMERWPRDIQKVIFLFYVLVALMIL